MSGLCISRRPAAAAQCQSPHAGPAPRARLPGARSQPRMRSRTASPGGAAAGQGRACVTAVYGGTRRSPPERSTRRAGQGADTHGDLHLAREWKGQREVTAAGTRASLQNHLATQHSTGHNRTQSSKEKARAPNRTDSPTDPKATAPA